MKIERKPVDLGKGRGKIVRVPAGHAPPNLDGFLEGDDIKNPLDVEYTEDIELDAQEEVSEALRAIIEEKRKRRDAYRLIVDTEFWFAVCFQSREQKENFLRQAGWVEQGLDGDKYLDGLQLADILELDIPMIPLPIPNLPKAAAGLRKEGLIMDLPEGVEIDR